jgi:hypothetical protein
LKKIIAFVLVVVAFVVLPGFVFAGFGIGGVNMQTRLEVSKDNINWDNYVAETNPGNQTLTVSPGDTIYFRLKTWDIGAATARNVHYNASYTNPQYIASFDPFHVGTQDDTDANGRAYVLGATDPVAGTMQFSISRVDRNTTETSGFESGVMAATISNDVPDQAVISATVQIASMAPLNDYNYSSGRVYADDQATTQVRILIARPVVTPSVTPSVTPPYPISVGK